MNKLFNKRGAFFFTIDTMMASLIVLLTLMLVLSIYFAKPVSEDIYHEMNNYVNFMTTRTMQDIRDNYQSVYDVVDTEDLSLYVHQNIYKLAEYDPSNATQLLKALTLFIIPQHIGLEYSVGNFTFQRNPHTRTLSKSGVSTRILTFYINESNQIRVETTNITMWS